MHIAQKISGEGFDTMKEDVQEILVEKEVEPTNEDLDEIAKQGSGVSDDEDGDEIQPIQDSSELSLLQWPKCQNGIPPSKKFSMTWKSCDPMLDHSLKFKHLICTALAPYAEMLKDLRQKAKQTRF